MQNHYETLGLERSAQQLQIKKAYLKLALKWHPDKNSEQGALNKFIQINEAYKTLSKDDTKTKYDKKLQNRDDIQNLVNLYTQYNEAEDFISKEDKDFLKNSLTSARIAKLKKENSEQKMKSIYNSQNGISKIGRIIMNKIQSCS